MKGVRRWITVPPLSLRVIVKMKEVAQCLAYSKMVNITSLRISYNSQDMEVT